MGRQSRTSVPTMRLRSLVVGSVFGNEIEEESHSVSIFSQLRSDPMRMGKRLVTGVAFEAVSGMIILVNAGFLGIETHYLATHEGQPASSHATIHNYFNVYFLVELCLRIW